MSKNVLVILICCIFSHVAQAAAPFYISTYSANSAIYAQTTEAKTQTTVGIPYGIRIIALTTSPTGDLYAVSTSPSALWKISRQTAVKTKVCDLLYATGSYLLYQVVFDKKGFLYGVDFGKGSLIRIDPAARTISVVGSTLPYASISALAIDRQGQVIAYDCVAKALLWLDLKTAKNTIIGKFSGIVGDIDFDADGTLYDFTYKSLYRVNLSTMNQSLIRTYQYGVSDNPRLGGFVLDWRRAYAVAASSDANGTIVPTGTCYLYPGESATFKAFPAMGWYMDSWCVNGSVLRTGTAAYDLQNCQASCTLCPVFKPFIYTIMATIVGPGTLQPTGTVLKNYGQTQHYVAKPALGYAVAGWYLDGILVQSGSRTFELSSISSDHQLSVNFAYRGLRNVYVNAASTTTTADGTFAKPFRDIQAAIDAAASDANIIITPGRYSQSVLLNDKTLTFAIADSLGRITNKKTIIEANGLDCCNSICLNWWVNNCTIDLQLYFEN